jgi:hypothetical protein
MRTARIEREIASVCAKYPGARAVDDPTGCVHLILPALPIPTGFTVTAARILVRVPALYPAEKLDLFWMHPAIARSNGAEMPNIMIRGVEVAGEQWTQVSWHDQSPHDENRISVLGFIRTIPLWFERQIVGT